MEITDELIHRFFRQECTLEEQQAASEFFRQHPEELEKYLNENEWVNFTDYPPLHPAVSRQMLAEIESHIIPPVLEKVNYYKMAGIAASIIVFLGIALLAGQYVYRNEKQERIAAVHESFVVTDTILNKTASGLQIRLPDSSTVLLSAKSEIIYQKAFNQKHRDIYLAGEAVFKVAKDKTRPFTVYAGGISTTALGTSFRVSAFKNKQETKVWLYTGKVVIKTKPDSAEASGKDIFLSPGQMLVIDKISRKAKVSLFTDSASSAGKPEEQTAVKIAGIRNIIQFQNEPLANVINLLQKEYQIKIQIKQDKLTNRNFTGAVNLRTDSPDDVLQTIAALNKLRIEKERGIYKLY